MGGCSSIGIGPGGGGGGGGGGSLPPIPPSQDGVTDFHTSFLMTRSPEVEMVCGAGQTRFASDAEKRTHIKKVVGAHVTCLPRWWVWLQC